MNRFERTTIDLLPRSARLVYLRRLIDLHGVAIMRADDVLRIARFEKCRPQTVVRPPLCRGISLRFWTLDDGWPSFVTGKNTAGGSQNFLQPPTPIASSTLSWKSTRCSVLLSKTSSSYRTRENVVSTTYKVPISIFIITYNELDHISKTVQAVRDLSDDIVIVD
jgi:hypothetical protein